MDSFFNITIKKRNLGILIDMKDNIIMLKKNKIKYKYVTNNYLTFKLNSLFDTNDNFTIGFHYNNNILEFIEIWQDVEFDEEYFFNLENKISTMYGQAPINISDKNSISYRTERDLPNCIIKHWMIERFGIEDHLCVYPKKQEKTNNNL